MKDAYELLHYRTLKTFKNKYYDGVLTVEHFDPEEKHFDKWIQLTTGDKNQGVNFAGYELEKEATKYLVQSFNPDAHPDEGQRVDVKDMLPIKINDSYARAVNNTVYEVADDISLVRHKPEKQLSFKELVNTLASFHHTSEKQYKLYWMVVLASYFSRCYARIATAPGFGKDSALKIMELLKGRANSVNAEVSRAKLEFLTNQKVLGVTELADLTKDEWSNMEQFLLDVADFTPSIPKRSRSYKGVDEILDVSDFSVLLLYNDLKDYSDKSGYFDNRAKQAVDDRFPKLRFNGTIEDDRLVEMEDKDVEQVVEDRMDEYRTLLQSLEYWEQNVEDELNRDWTADFDYESARWRKNMKRIAKMVNLYAEDEDEYKAFIDLLKGRVTEYGKMLQYPSVYEATVEDMNDEGVEYVDEKVDAQQDYDSKMRVLKGIQKNGIDSQNVGHKGLSDF